MQKPSESQRTRYVWCLLAGLGALLWAYWTAFVEMADRWAHSPEYSHGYLVPLLALGLLWFRYDRLKMGQPRSVRPGLLLLALGLGCLFVLPAAFLVDWGFLFAALGLFGAGLMLRATEFDPEKLRPSWWGLPLLAVGIAMRLVAARYYFGWFDHLSLLPCVAGVVLLTVGWHPVRWGWPAVLFLVFMVPLPYSLEGALREPLRNVGTKASTYLMQTVGLPAIADGNRHEIFVGTMSHPIGVTEACSGLSMLMIFIALSTAVAVVIRRPIWDKAVILLSAVPIALVSNVVRIAVTGMMLYAYDGLDVYLGIGSWTWFEMDGVKFAGKFFHDWAGWLMMPFALLLMAIELAIMKRLIIVEEEVPLSVRTKKSLSSPAASGDGATPEPSANGESTNTQNESQPQEEARASASMSG